MAGATSASNTDAAAEQSGSGSTHEGTSLRGVNSNGEGSSSSPVTLGRHAESAQSSGTVSRSASASVSEPGLGTVRTLDEVMKEPSTSIPDVVVLNSVSEPRLRRDTLDPREDLWMSTADGRYSSSIIPLKVGTSPHTETFYVHKHILTKYEYFEKALCGSFKESETQSIELPEEDPAIFHFLVSYFYEGRYDPIKPLAAVLVPDQPKGKDPELENANPASAANAGADSDSDRSLSSLESDVSTVSRRRRERRMRRAERQYERLRQKHPGHHRTNCPCPLCNNVHTGTPCWSCRAPRLPPPPPPPPGAIHPNVLVAHPRPPPGHPAHRRRANRRGPHPPPPPPPPMPPSSNTNPNPRLPTPADLHTWLLTYNLSLSVYISASKFLLEPLKRCVARHIIDLLESAGPDCASLELLYSCSTLYSNLPSYDPLLKMVFARVAFLQCWKLSSSRAQQGEGEGDKYLVENPEIAALLLKEMASRTDDGALMNSPTTWMGGDGRLLPSMERVGDAWADGPRGGGGGGGYGNGSVNGGYNHYHHTPGHHPPPPPPPPPHYPHYQHMFNHAGGGAPPAQMMYGHHNYPGRR
ncbi:hypothetical protein QBC40DRAFT_50752 [Triangularia verruculosa]|uniref:BTB domain-containing protein n=1 Tax=Triangularia verruculosa TaxID=2587418 RepID=A0AAN7B1W2_9PEZI|nr:hypothetical protein QBC40DRAFT_50752 [Triangularia verruculosa]